MVHKMTNIPDKRVRDLEMAWKHYIHIWDAENGMQVLQTCLRHRRWHVSVTDVSKDARNSVQPSQMCPRHWERHAGVIDAPEMWHARDGMQALQMRLSCQRWRASIPRHRRWCTSIPNASGTPGTACKHSQCIWDARDGVQVVQMHLGCQRWDASILSTYEMLGMVYTCFKCRWVAYGI